MPETTLLMGVLGAGGAALLSGVAGALAGRLSKKQAPQGPAAKDVAERLLADARIERDTFVRHAEIGAREEALVLRAEAAAFEQQEEERLVRLAATLAGRQADIEARSSEAAEAAERLKKRQAPLAQLES